MSKKRVYYSELTALAPRMPRDFLLDGDLTKECWNEIPRIVFENSYTPAVGYPEARTEVAVGWTPNYVYLAFWCMYTELNVYEGEDTSEQRWELWDRDVAEVFINPFPENISRYWEYYKERYYFC